MSDNYSFKVEDDNLIISRHTKIGSSSGIILNLKEFSFEQIKFLFGLFSGMFFKKVVSKKCK